MAEENKINPYAGAIQVTENPYAGAIAVTQQPYTGALPVSQEPEKEKVSFLSDLKNIILTGARQVLAGTTSAYGFTQQFSPSEIGQAIGQAIQEGDTEGAKVLDTVLKNRNVYQRADVILPQAPKPQYETDIGLPDKSIKIGDRDIPLGFKDVPVGEIAADLLGFAGAYRNVAGNIVTSGAKTLPEIAKQGAKVVAAGAAAEQLAFSPYEQRLSNLIQEKIPNEYTAFLQADPNDNEAVARFKMALEGGIIGVPIEALFRVAGKFRANKKLQQQEAVEVPQEQAIVKSDEIEIPTKVETVQAGPYAGANVVSPMSVAEAKAKKQAEAATKKKDPFKIDPETGLIKAKINKNEFTIAQNQEGKFDVLQKDTRTDEEVNTLLENLQYDQPLGFDEVQNITKQYKTEKIDRPYKTFDSLDEAKADIQKTFAPSKLPASLRPTPEPKVRTAKSYVANNISPQFARVGELVDAIGDRKGRIPVWARPYGGDVRAGKGFKDFDEIAEAMDQDQFFGLSEFERATREGRPQEDLTDKVIDALTNNKIHQDDYINYKQWQSNEQRKLDKIKTLEQYNYDVFKMTDDDVQNAFKRIRNEESDILRQADSIEKENIAKQQTDNIYQEMMAREKSRSITEEDLLKIPPRESIGVNEIPPSYTQKDFGIHKFPKRQAPASPADILPTKELPDDKFAGNINLDKINEPNEIKSIIRSIAKNNAGFEEARRGVVKFGSKGENLEALARSLDLSDSLLLQRKIGQAFNAEEVYAARILLDEAVKDAYDLSLIAKGADATQVDLVKFENAMARVAAIQEQIAGITAEAGRALRSFREAVGPASSKNIKARDKIIQDFINLKGGVNKIQDIAKKMSLLEDEAQLAKFMRDQYKPTFTDYVQEFWINALLSSPSTHLVNVLSNTLVAGLTPVEYFAAAAIGKFRKGGDKITFGEAGARLLGTVYGALDGVRAARKAIIDGEVLDPMTKLELQRQESIPGVAGELVRVPGKALVAEDAFFKSIGYRQELWGRSFRQAQKEGKGIKRAYEIMKNPEEIAPDIHLDAIQAGRYQTFTEPLREGKIGAAGQALQRTIAKIPALRYIFPFVRTPVNILRYAFERMPGMANFTTAYKEAIKQGGSAADLARAKLAVGSAIAGGVAYYAGSGIITGRGPSDPRERSVLLETGWQPYSIKVGDKYYSYNRFEPIGILFGVTADITDIAKYVNEEKQKEEDINIGELISMISASFTENITNKTFLTGLSDVIEMINDPDRYGEATVRRFLSSFVPTVLYYERKSDDPIIRDVQSYGDAFTNRFPELFSEIGLATSVDLPPKRNIFGDIKTYKETLGGKYSPVNVSPIKEDSVFNEFVSLGYIPPFPKRNIGGVKLTPQQYEDLLYVQKVLNTEQTINALIKSPKYKLLPKQARIDSINEIILDNQKRARELIMVKYPEIIQKQAQEMVRQATE